MTLASTVSRLLDDQLIVSAGEVAFDVPKRVSEPFGRGLKAAVTLTGEISCRIDERAPLVMSGPNLCLILNDSDHRREQIFMPDKKLRYVLVHMSQRLIEETFDIRFDELIERSRGPDGLPGPVALSRTADRTIQAIASRIIVCPMRGASRKIYMAGAGLELAALALDHFIPFSARSGARLSAQERDKIEAARDLLLRDCRAPLGVAALARAVGMNERKLNIGFRQVYGATIHAYLQEHRLQLAYRKISSGETSVSEAAYEVGYAPAHFSTIFRRRYGFSPSDLR